jgi:hypothetical protein
MSVEPVDSVRRRVSLPLRVSGLDGFGHPLHQLALVAMGTPLFDNLDLEQLAEEAAIRGRWTFLLTVAPMRVPGGLGSPVNPTVVF